MRKGQEHSQETKEKIRLKALGRGHSLESKQKMSVQRQGENHWHWNPDRELMLARKKSRWLHRRFLKRMIVNKMQNGLRQRTQEILGYTAEQFRQDIESKFLDGMTWENHGDWHVDHIKPVSAFPEDADPAVVNALSNLRPFWKFDNLSKGSRVEFHS